MNNSIAQNLNVIRQKIITVEQKFNRLPGSVRLLAASKKQSADKLLAAYNAGQRLFGESYLQEALEKQQALSQPDIEWHFIGPIQSNKTRKIAEHFSWVHSIDSEKNAQRFNDQRPQHLPPLNICIEVNISGESTKSGVSLKNLNALIEFCSHLPRLKVRGLMTIPAPADEFSAQRQAFHQLNELFISLQQKYKQLDTLSMGMSEDFEAAIAEGSTIVRIGVAIFGPRL
jgi:pyridoxal phosphate enzyme (YggS family)